MRRERKIIYTILININSKFHSSAMVYEKLSLHFPSDNEIIFVVAKRLTRNIQFF